MVTGKIKWFGGFNKKTEKKNNFGFIELIENENSDDIRVRRKHVPENLQTLFEEDRNKGEGIYIEFDLDESNHAINIKLLTLVGIIEWFNDGRGYIKCEGNSDVRINSDNQFYAANTIVFFGIRYNFKYKKNEAILAQRVDINATPEMIQKCVDSNNFTICVKFILQYIQTLELSEAISFISKKLDTLNEDNKLLLINKVFPDCQNLFIRSYELRKYLDRDQYIELMNNYIESVDEKNQEILLDELLNNITNASESEKSFYWDKIIYLRKCLHYKNRLWNFAPSKYKKELVSDKYKKIFEKTSSNNDNNQQIISNILLEWIKLESWEQDILVFELKNNSEHLLTLSSELRQLVLKKYDLKSYCDFINKYLPLVEKSTRQELWKELIKNIKQSTLEEREIYWNNIKYLKSNLKYKNYLWDIAPLAFQQQIIKEMFNEFFELVDDFETSSYFGAKFINKDWKTLYNFDENEKKMINIWCSKSSNKDFEMAKMMSARGAEKLVIDFYRKLGYQVEDISVHQVIRNSNDWILGDIRINSNVLLDVKNARTDRNSNVYSEFCVRQLKKNRGNDVKIAAVLSPYLQKYYMDKPENFPSHYKTPNNPKFLGTCTKQQIEELLKTFSNSFMRIDMLRDADSNRYLPPWLFDYDEKFYANQIAIINKFNKLEDSKIPTWEHLSILDKNLFQILPLFIAAKRQVTQDYLEKLSKWKCDFINYLISLPVQLITLPYLFLAILTHFLTKLSDNNEVYNPQEYEQILGNYSLKIYDPLNLIHELCDSLTSIWNNRNTGTMKLREFKIFKLSGRGLLQGQRSERDKLTTLLAYCGGIIRNDQGKYQGKCGFTPLVIGKHKTCKNCGRLICSECGYCCDNCSNHPKTNYFDEFHELDLL
ncbi:hypothetical protein [Crocosphaera sp.]|uniref:hypothetical protein n=1 Tax=Crocosphaera sp. TaxID=2729996 RepID=UPI00260A932E|nr:hypothetical protein [Crocosphaera sp.]MDJ0580411.1 hypothetical protein [Crocosphaera sp.]